MSNCNCCCLRGPRGFTGATGPQGPRGERGPQGETGPCGCEGQEGPQGATGIPGPIGPEGMPGPAGPMGPTGAIGADGLSPSVGENGNWWVGTTDTGISAIGPAIAGNYEHLVNAGAQPQDSLLYFPNGGLVQRGMSIDSTRKIITLENAGFYRISYMGYLYATSGNPKIVISRNGTTDMNFFQVSPTEGGLTVIDVVYPLLAGDTLSLVVRDGDVSFWENTTNEIGGYLTIVGWGQ